MPLEDDLLSRSKVERHAPGNISRLTVDVRFRGAMI
jgi:hypothetical protein